MRAIYKENDANFPRLKTDRLFVDFDAKFDWNDNADRLIRLVEKVQLKDVALWKRLVDQFRTHPDDADNGWRSEFFGKLMRGGSFVWLYTRDEALYGILTDAVEDMLSTQDEAGRFSGYTVEKEFRGWDIWGRKYAMLGFEYFLEICKDEALAARIVAAMERHADYILERIGSEPGKLAITKTSGIWGTINSCSILEPMVRLYNITKKQRYLDFSLYIASTGGMDNGDLIQLACEAKLFPYQFPQVKAYEMMSFFEGLLELYRVTGTETYRKAAENFVDLVRRSEITIIGSAGCFHELFDHAAVTQTDPANMIYMQETCVTVTWMKLCMQLLCLNGDAQMADCIETSAYNGLFGSVNTEGVDKNNGFAFDSYSPLMPNKRGRATGGYKVMEDGNSFGCCAAIGACGMGMVPRVACMLKDDGVTLNLYHDGAIQTLLPSGRSLTLTVSGGYPANGAITISVAPEQEEAFTLSVRVPAWSKKTSLTVNGEAIAVNGTGYVDMARTWKAGDTVVLTLDMRTRMLEQNHFVSFTRGPLVLARDGRLGEDVMFPLPVLLDEEGFVLTAPSAVAPFPTVFEEKILLTLNRTATLVDYSSAGKTWDYDSITAAWMPKELRTQ